MIKFKRVQAIPLSKLPPKVVVRWQMDVRDEAELANYEFLVHRQHSGQNGQPGFQHVNIDRKPLSEPHDAKDPKSLEPVSRWIDGLDFPWFVDFSDQLQNLTEQSNYRVECRRKDTQESVLSEEFAFEGQLDLVGLYVVDEMNFLLRDVTGSPSLIFQRRRGGIKCKVCYDPIQKKRLSSFCTNCYGTGWTLGFFDPIDAYIDFSPNPKDVRIESWGEVQNNDTNALASNFPNINPGDVIRELQENRMWRVVNATVTEKRRCQMLQFLRLTEIKPGDVEYTLPNDERFQIRKLDEYNLTRQKLEF
jgi:hypothetical protein